MQRIATRQTCQSRIFCARRRFSPYGMTANPSRLSMATRCASWCQTSMRGRARSGCAGSSCWIANCRAYGNLTDITFTATRSKSNDFRAEGRDAGDMSQSQVRLLEPKRWTISPAGVTFIRTTTEGFTSTEDSTTQFVGETSDRSRRWTFCGGACGHQFFSFTTGIDAPCPAEDALAVLPQHIKRQIISSGRTEHCHLSCALTLAGDTEFPCNIHEVYERAGLHFPHHLTSVGFHRDLADAQFEADLFVQEATDDQTQDFPFAATKCCVTIPQRLDLRLNSKCSLTTLYGLLYRAQ